MFGTLLLTNFHVTEIMVDESSDTSASLKPAEKFMDEDLDSQASRKDEMEIEGVHGSVQENSMRLHDEKEIEGSHGSVQEISTVLNYGKDDNTLLGTPLEIKGTDLCCLLNSDGPSLLDHVL